MSVMEISELQFCVVNKALNKYNLDSLLPSEREKLVTTWFKMNQFAYAERYNDNCVAFKPNYRKVIRWNAPDKVGTLKLLECIHYNIPSMVELEHANGVSSSWYNALEILEHHINALKRDIINEHTNYQTQPWQVV